MDNKTAFEEAVALSKTLTTKPANDVLLQLYALYKQATTGDVDVPAPENAFDFVARAKYNAWDELKGKTKEEAMVEYANLVSSLRN